MPLAEAVKVPRTNEEKLAQVLKDIEAVEKKKLITVIAPGASDAVLYIQPLDLRGKDPEEDVEIAQWQVSDTDYSQGYANHKRDMVKTGRFQKRGPKGPFGPTYKINTDNQDGKREWEDLKRVIEQHSSRHAKVPEPMSYHQEINDQGMRDLKNISIEKADVPIAVLENYKPLMDLWEQRDALMLKLNKALPTPPANDEEAAVEKASGAVFQCDDLECDFVAKNANGLRLHQSKHKNKEGQEG